MSYIPKQEKRTRERLEAKLDHELLRKLEQYCAYLDSDRDYIIAKALEIAFEKDKGFAEWLKTQPAIAPISLPGAQPEKDPGRKQTARGFELTPPREPQGR
jgi:hypothetical protein